MTAKIIDGKKIANQIKQDIKKEISTLKIKPGLAAILIGEDSASQIYVGHKKKACDEIGFHSQVYTLPKETSEVEVLELIDSLNADKKIHGIIVQLPLPSHINEHLVTNYVHAYKDADGFSTFNLGSLLSAKNMIIPATPKGIMRLLESYAITLEGKHAVVIGRSNIVGKPVSLLLQQKNCTVTMCHSRTKELKKYTKDADILVVAIGKANFITKEMIKKGSVVIDVGMNRLDSKIVGDVDFDSVKEIASFITPVPGGVGQMTIAMLLENTLECMKLAENKKKL